MRVPAADVGEAIVGDAREFARDLRRSDQFERRIGERKHLLQPVELLDQLQPRIDIDERIEARKRCRRDVIGHDLLQPFEVGPRREVVEHVDDHVGSSRALCGPLIYKQTRCR
jgi:hypothetical protein